MSLGRKDICRDPGLPKNWLKDHLLLRSAILRLPSLKRLRDENADPAPW